jgi:hypothetical protein
VGITLRNSDNCYLLSSHSFVPWIGDLNMHHLSSMQYKTFSWRPLELQEGQYNWAGFEAYWDQLWEMGLRVGFRISTATPGGYGIDVPQWLIDQGVEMRDYSIDGYTGKAPDWDSPIFLEKHTAFIKALGARYNNDPRVAWVDIGSYGFWGEWHVYRNPGLAASDSSKKKILDAYFEAFPDKRLVIAFDDDFATRYVTEHGEGIRNDCLGTRASNNWYLESLNRIDPTLNERAWKIGIITGEFCGGDQGALEGTTTRFQSRMPIAVVASSLLRIAQHIEGIGRLLKTFFSSLIVRVSVRVVFQGEFAVGRFQLVISGAAADA